MSHDDFLNDVKTLSAASPLSGETRFLRYCGTSEQIDATCRMLQVKFYNRNSQSLRGQPKRLDTRLVSFVPLADYVNNAVVFRVDCLESYSLIRNALGRPNREMDASAILADRERETRLRREADAMHRERPVWINKLDGGVLVFDFPDVVTFLFAERAIRSDLEDQRRSFEKAT